MNKKGFTYHVHNQTEDIVDLVLKKVLKEEPSLCRCDVCTRDMKSIALNGLKPRYAFGHKEIKRLEELGHEELYAAMSMAYKAMDKVREAPRHNEKGQSLELHNYSEDLIFRVFLEVAEQRSGLCTCPECLSRIMALSLDQVKPKYTTSDRGNAYSRIDELDNKLLPQLMSIVYGAMELVKKEANHSPSHP